MCLYIYSCCSGSATADVEEYCRRFPVHRIPDRRVFSKVFNTVHKCSILSVAHVSSEQAYQQHVKEHENILEMVLCNPHYSKWRLSTSLGVSQKRVRWTLCEDGLCPFHLQRVKIYTQGTVTCVYNFVIGCVLITNCFHQYYSLTKLLSPVMESTTHETYIDGLTTIHMVLWKYIFSVVSLSMCGAVWTMTWWLVPLF